MDLRNEELSNYNYLVSLCKHNIERQPKDEMDDESWGAQIGIEKPLWVKRFLPKQTYLIEYLPEYETNDELMVHEMMHAFDNVGTIFLHSIKPKFNSIAKHYKDIVRESISDSDVAAYACSNVEIFARVLNCWLYEEGIVTVLLYDNIVDQLAVEYYMDNRHVIVDYFDNIFPEILEIIIDKIEQVQHEYNL